MSKQEMILFVQDQMRKGLSKEESIRNLALFSGEDDPVDPVKWFEKITK